MTVPAPTVGGPPDRVRSARGGRRRLGAEPCRFAMSLRSPSTPALDVDGRRGARRALEREPGARPMGCEPRWTASGSSRPDGLAAGRQRTDRPRRLGMPASVRSARSRLDELRHGEPPPTSHGHPRDGGAVARVPAVALRRPSLPGCTRVGGARSANARPRRRPGGATSAADAASCGSPSDRSPATGRASAGQRRRLAGESGTTCASPDSPSAARGGRQAQWSQARPPRPEPDRGPNGPSDGPPPAPPTGVAATDPSVTARSMRQPAIDPPSGVPWALAGGGAAGRRGHLPPSSAALGLGSCSSRWPAVLLAIATARWNARVRPDEAWVGRWLVAAVFVKLMASYLRYHTLVETYGGVGDATRLRQHRPQARSRLDGRRHGTGAD